MLPEALHALNLLPESEKKVIKRSRTLSFVHEFLTIFFIFALIGSGALFAARISLEQAFGKAVTTPIPGFREVMVLNRKIKAANRWIELRDRVLHPKYLSWPKLFAALDTVIPKGTINIAALTVSDKGVLTLTGVAETRDDLIKLREGMKGMSLFEEVMLPLQFLAQEVNAPFSLSASLNQKELRLIP